MVVLQRLQEGLAHQLTGGYKKQGECKRRGRNVQPLGTSKVRVQFEARMTKEMWLCLFNCTLMIPPRDKWLFVPAFSELLFSGMPTTIYPSTIDPISASFSLAQLPRLLKMLKYTVFKLPAAQSYPITYTIRPANQVPIIPILKYPAIPT